MRTVATQRRVFAPPWSVLGCLVIALTCQAALPAADPETPSPQTAIPHMLEMQWSAAPALPRGMQDNDGGRIGNFLVMAGGFCHGIDDDWKPGKYRRGFLNQAWALDLKNEHTGWVELPPFPGAARQEMYAATVADAIYLWGGFNYSKPYTYRDGFKLSRKNQNWQWTQLPPLPRPGAAGNMVAVGTHIYLLGGMDYDSTRYYVATDRTGQVTRFGAQLFVFDTSQPAGGWQALPACPGTPRMMAGMGVVGHQVFVLGGYTVDRVGSAHCVVDGWRFDTRRTTWHRLRDLPSAVAGFGSGSIVYRNRYLLLPTGYPYPTILNSDETSRPRYGPSSRVDRSQWKQHPKLAGVAYENHFWVYDSQTDLYGRATPLPYDDHGPATHVVDHSVYLFPGETGGFWWKGEYFGHAPEFVLKGQITELDWQRP